MIKKILLSDLYEGIEIQEEEKYSVIVENAFCEPTFNHWGFNSLKLDVDKCKFSFSKTISFDVWDKNISVHKYVSLYEKEFYLRFCDCKEINFSAKKELTSTDITLYIDAWFESKDVYKIVKNLVAFERVFAKKFDKLSYEADKVIRGFDFNMKNPWVEDTKVECLTDEYINLEKGSIYTISREFDSEYVYLKETIGVVQKQCLKIVD